MTLMFLIYVHVRYRVKKLQSYLRVVQLEGRRETLREGVTVSGQPTANGTCQVTVAVQVAWQIRAANTGCSDRNLNQMREFIRNQ